MKLLKIVAPELIFDEYRNRGTGDVEEFPDAVGGVERQIDHGVGEMVVFPHLVARGGEEAEQHRHFGMLALEPFDHRAALLKLAERRGMEPYGPGLVAELAAQQVGSAVLAPEHFSHFAAAERNHLGGGSVKRDGSVVEQVHSFRRIGVGLSLQLKGQAAEVSGLGHLDGGDGLADAADGLWAAHKLGDVKHMGAFALPYHGQAEGVHDVAHMVAVVGDPFQHHRFGCGRREVIEAFKHSDELLHYLGSALLPAFANILLGIFLGGLEEESALIPEVGEQVGAALDHVDGPGGVVGREVVGIHPVGLHDRAEHGGKLAAGGVHEVFVVEPFSFLEGKPGA